MSDSSFQIVHLSDLHLTKRDETPRSEPKLFGRLCGMNQSFRRLLRAPLLQQCQLLLVTGDITDRGDLESWQNFWEFLDEAGLKDRVLALPGNHDVCHLGSPRIRSNYLLKNEDLDRARRGLRLGGKNQGTKFPWAQVIVPGHLAVLGVDSTNAGNTLGITNAQGRLGFEQMEAFGRLLRRREIEVCPIKIVALHHSPNLPKTRIPMQQKKVPYGALARWGHEIPQPERRAFRLLCAMGRVRLVVHGHLHFCDDRRINNVRIIGASASTEPRKGSSRALQIWSYSVKLRSHIVRCQLHDIPLQSEEECVQEPDARDVPPPIHCPADSPTPETEGHRDTSFTGECPEA